MEGKQQMGIPKQLERGKTSQGVCMGVCVVADLE